MKNPTLVRLAGIGLFGMSFLSPASTEKRWPVIDINPNPFHTAWPLSYLAFNQEPSSPETIDVIAVPQPGLTAQDHLSDSAVSTVHIPTKIHQWVAEDSLSPRKKVAQKHSSYNSDEPAQNEVLSPSAKSEEDIIYYNPAERKISSSLAPASKTISSSAEILPPTNYVDELPKTDFRKKIKPVAIIHNGSESGTDSYPEDLMDARILQLSQEAEKNNYSNDYAFLINLGLKSGKKRFAIVNLRTRTIMSSGLVAHGRGQEKFTLNKKYSNRSGSSCSSLGFYKVGASYHGSFGKSFRLVGLNATNNNAIARAIVLHSMSCIPDEEIDYPICQSEGCPSVSARFLEQLSDIIQASNKPILLWVFDPAVDEDLKP